jgi:hypothetical protein
MHESWKYKAALLAASLSYWLLCSFSAGIFIYYSADMTPKASSFPNPRFLINLKSLNDLHSSGVVWFPGGHLETAFLFGTSFLPRSIFHSLKAEHLAISP